LRAISSQLIDQLLFSFVQSNFFVDSLSNLVKGALYPAVTDSQVRSQIIPFPPLPEQRRIAALLSEQIAEAYRLRAGLELQLNEINALPAALLRRAFAGEL
jgi:type I restriction enzyme S subunit